MRRSGIVKDARGLGPNDHVCWSYADPAEFAARAGEFLGEGLAAGQKVCYVGNGDDSAVLAELVGPAGWREALRSGAAQIVPVDEAYPVGTAIEPRTQVKAYAKETEAAVAAGFTGYRVAAEVTALVRTPEQLDAFARYEYLIDLYMAKQPFSALCGYRRSELGSDSIAQLTCLHPTSNDEGAGFRLHASEREGLTAVLSGELDLSSRDVFGPALNRAALQPHDGELVLDATELTFVDHRSLLTLAEHARQCEATVVLQTARPGLARLAGLLDVLNLRVEVMG